MDNRTAPVFMIFLLGSCLSFYGQMPSASTTIQKVDTYYRSLMEFDLEMEYRMYKGYTGNHLTESYKGTIYKSKDATHIKILGSEIIQFPEKQITINKESRTLVYSSSSGAVLQNSPMEISTFLNYYNETGSIIKGNSIIHEMVLKDIQLQIPYNKVIIYVNKDTYQIEKQVLYFTSKVPFIDGNGKEVLDSARMEISFKQSAKVNKKIPKLEDYVVLKANNEVRLAKAYTTYTMINQTNR